MSIVIKRFEQLELFMLDPIADMLTRIRNAQRAGHSEVIFPSSKFKKAIVAVLKKRKFIKDFTEIEGKSFNSVKIVLGYRQDERGNSVIPLIKQIKRVSKEGQRIYVQKGEIRKVKSGLGVAIVSTSRGVMGGEEAYKQGIGGELVCEVW